MNSPLLLNRRQAMGGMLAGAGMATVAPSRLLFAEEPGAPIRPDVRGAYFEAVEVLDLGEFELPKELVNPDGRVVTEQPLWAGQAVRPYQENVLHLQQMSTPQYRDSYSCVVPTLETARAALPQVWQSGRFDEVRMYVARQTEVNGQPQLYLPERDGVAVPSETYRNGQLISSTADADWTSAIAEADAFIGNDGFSLTPMFAEHDRGLILPDSEFVYAGGNRRWGARGGRLSYNNAQQGSCGYSYGANCRPQYSRSNCSQGNCRLGPLSIVGGLFRGEFMQPLNGGMRHLRFGQKLVAMIFPRVAYNKGWIDCRTARILLVRRLLVMIIAGSIAGAAAGGGGAAGLIFIG